eukprot:TRINITY_DN16497_c0_g1_i4.p1 TRINITY_DN16497_c0_g1~~TRINITY_DN16497_c0_g1_i4.p1  ORF type:complete len:493 (+),score=61.39 TRINITY_DN16497_c0_g1_i4:128-1606(+)
MYSERSLHDGYQGRAWHKGGQPLPIRRWQYVGKSSVPRSSTTMCMLAVTFMAFLTSTPFGQSRHTQMQNWVGSRDTWTNCPTTMCKGRDSWAPLIATKATPSDVLSITSPDAFLVRLRKSWQHNGRFAELAAELKPKKAEMLILMYLAREIIRQSVEDWSCHDLESLTLTGSCLHDINIETSDIDFVLDIGSEFTKEELQDLVEEHLNKAVLVKDARMTSKGAEFTMMATREINVSIVPKHYFDDRSVSMPYLQGSRKGYCDSNEDFNRLCSAFFTWYPGAKNTARILKRLVADNDIELYGYQIMAMVKRAGTTSETCLWHKEDEHGRKLFAHMLDEFSSYDGRPKWASFLRAYHLSARKLTKGNNKEELRLAERNCEELRLVANKIKEVESAPAQTRGSLCSYAGGGDDLASMPENEFPSEAAIVSVLIDADHPLEAREVWLLAHGKDPTKHQVGDSSTVKKMKAKLYQMEKQGVLKVDQGRWVLAYTDAR